MDPDGSTLFVEEPSKMFQQMTKQTTFVTIGTLRAGIQKPYNNEPQHEISNNVVCATSKASDQPAHMRSLIRAFAKSLEYSISVKLLTEHLLEFLSLKRGCTGSYESTLVKMPHCWKSHVMAQISSYST